jgi:PAS domain S-box-containing protein
MDNPPPPSDLEQLHAQLKRLQEENARLQEERDRYKICFERAPTGILLQDSDGTILDINPAHADILGWKREELIGKKIHMLAHEEIRWKVEENIRRILGGEILRHSVRSERKDGQICYSALNESKIPLGSDREGIIVVSVDVTELKAQEQKLAANELLLKKALDAAHAAATAKSNFLANMSHEMRTPLNGIIASAELLGARELEPELLDSISIIRESSGILLDLINDVLDFSRIDAGKVELEEILFRPANVLKSTSSICGLKAREKGLILEIHTEPGVPEVLVGDPSRLRQVLLNLATNGIKFTDKGFVRISMHLVDVQHGTQQGEVHNLATVEFRIEDSGIGISSEALQRIFNPFTQEEASTTRKFGGTGLGLTISRQLVELMQGTISVQSAPGKGSLFSMRIPFRLPNPDSIWIKAEESTGKVPLGLGKLTLLLVEDNTINQRVMTKVLATLGVETIKIAVNGREAVEQSEKMQFDVILMDCQMPEMDGFEATLHIRKGVMNRETPIIALTANAFKETAEACFAVGMTGFLTKPVQKDALAKALKERLILRQDYVI